MNRRSFLASLGALGAATMLPRSARADGAPPKFLIVLAASGGASMLDGPLAIRASECAHAATLNTFEDPKVVGFQGSPLRAVDQQLASLGSIPMAFSATQSDFVEAHRQDMMVATWTRTSVNHAIAQRRAVTGNEAWGGRTLQELVALQHGGGFALPNVHLVSGTAFTDRGNDPTLPAWAYGETVSDPRTWPLALDAIAGGVRPLDRDLLNRARTVRDTAFDPATPFHRVFGNSPRLAHWQSMRDAGRALEPSDLIRKLMVAEDTADFPLGAVGLSSSADAPQVRAAFPDYATDPLHAQAALGFLLLKHRVSVTVTLGVNSDVGIQEGAELGVGGAGGGGAGLCGGADDGGDPVEPPEAGGLPEGTIFNPPIAFDFSHQGSRSTQAFMWQRLYRVAHGLITLLQSEDMGDGSSMWDHTVIYVATDFGRSRNRPANAPDFSTGHHLNNAALVISPMARGNTVLGGVNPDTGLTYGFDPTTGAPQTGREMTEAEIFAGLLGICDVDTSGSGLPSVPAMRRHA